MEYRFQPEMSRGSLSFPMFGGTFGRKVIHATHPFIVLEGEQVSGSFKTLEAAEDFVTHQRSFSASVLQHNGQKWVIAKGRMANPLRTRSKS